MFYLASDNPLAPAVVAQLKALKQAGFHPDANVIAHFDPQTEETPTHVFEVNLINKLNNPGKANIGFRGNDPFVRTLIEDKLWRNQKGRDGTKIRELIKNSLPEGLAYDPPLPPVTRIVRDSGKRKNSNEVGPKESLAKFLKFCFDEYPAHHYMLFLLGHGQIVGNDIFLFDEHAADEQSLSLKDLGEVLGKFKERMTNQKAPFELVGFHSCSVSSLEVAYELQGTANYMLASQGPAFVGSWPYRQILISIFNDLESRKRSKSALKKEDIEETINRIFEYCRHNSSDYILAGYSSDLALCKLDKVADIKQPLKELSDLLVKSLTDESESLIAEFVQLSHLKAQSYWQENYTDLFDFCLCLREQCEKYERAAKQMAERLMTEVPQTERLMTETMQAIYTAAGNVIKVLTKGTREDPDKLVVRAEFLGPAYQYSHGLSVFFPWVEPSEDNQIRQEYAEYNFKETGWGNFLGLTSGNGKPSAAGHASSEKRPGYFHHTRRLTHKEEQLKRREEQLKRAKQRMHGEAVVKEEILPETSTLMLQEDIASLVYNEEGQLSNESALGGGKTSAIDPTGDDCACASIKNYPRDTRALSKKGSRAHSEKRSRALSEKRRGAESHQPPPPRPQSFAMSQLTVTSVDKL